MPIIFQNNRTLFGSIDTSSNAQKIITQVPSSSVELIRLSSVSPGEGGRLIIEGDGTNSTILVVDEHKVFIRAHYVRQFTLRRITLKRQRKMAGQGTVVSNGR